MAERKPAILWEKAEYLAVEKGLTLDQVCVATGISLAALKKRSAQCSWVERRKAKMSWSVKMRLVANKQIERILSGKERNLDGLYKIARAVRDLDGDPTAGRMDVAAPVWETLRQALAELEPGLTETLRRHEPEILRRLELQFGESAATPGAGSAKASSGADGLTEAQVAEIRKKVLGL